MIDILIEQNKLEKELFGLFLLFGTMMNVQGVLSIEDFSTNKHKTVYSAFIFIG